jgi:hypothetical protein
MYRFTIEFVMAVVEEAEQVVDILNYVTTQV